MKKENQMEQLTRQGVRNLNHLQPKRPSSDRPDHPCDVGLHRKGPRTRTADGYCVEIRCADCGELVGFESYYGSR